MIINLGIMTTLFKRFHNEEVPENLRSMLAHYNDFYSKILMNWGMLVTRNEILKLCSDPNSNLSSANIKISIQDSNSFPTTSSILPQTNSKKENSSVSLRNQQIPKNPELKDESPTSVGLTLKGHVCFVCQTKILGKLFLVQSCGSCQAQYICHSKCFTRWAQKTKFAFFHFVLHFIFQNLTFSCKTVACVLNA